MKAATVIGLLLFPCLILAQSTTITITDNNGNQAQGTSPQEQEQIDAFCNEHPGDVEDYFEGRLIKCDAAPASPSLKWIKWKMGSLRDNYQSNLHSRIQFGMDQIVEDFNHWQSSYCQMARGKSHNDVHYDKKKCE